MFSAMVCKEIVFLQELHQYSYIILQVLQTSYAACPVVVRNFPNVVITYPDFTILNIGNDRMFTGRM
jgi:hypothetical protein